MRERLSRREWGKRMLMAGAAVVASKNLVACSGSGGLSAGNIGVAQSGSEASGGGLAAACPADSLQGVPGRKKGILDAMRNAGIAHPTVAEANCVAKARGSNSVREGEVVCIPRSCLGPR